MADNNKNIPPKTGSSSGKFSSGSSPPPIPSFLGKKSPSNTSPKESSDTPSSPSKKYKKTVPSNASPLPQFLEKEPVSDQKTDKKNSTIKQVNNFSSETNNVLTDAHFTWVQEYLAKSNQYFFCINRFTIFGLSGALSLLGVLFFIGGFLTALFLISYNKIYEEETQKLQNLPIVYENIDITTKKSSDLKKIKKTSKSSSKIKLRNKKQPASYSPTLIKKNDHNDVLNTPPTTVHHLVKNSIKQASYKSIVLFASPIKNKALEKYKELEQKGYSVFIVHRPATEKRSANYRVQIGAYKAEKFANDVLNFMREEIDYKDISMNNSILKDKSEKIIYPR